MDESMIRLLLTYVHLLVGAGDICFAIDHFKREHYFRFGVWLMCGILSVSMMIKCVFAL